MMKTNTIFDRFSTAVFLFEMAISALDSRVLNESAKTECFMENKQEA